VRNKIFVILALALALAASADVIGDYKAWVNSTLEPVNQSLYVMVDAGMKDIIENDEHLVIVIGLENSTFGMINGYSDFYNDTCGPVTDAYPLKVKGFITLSLLLEVVLVVMRWK
jgi:hypothetical protein